MQKHKTKTSVNKASLPTRSNSDQRKKRKRKNGSEQGRDDSATVPGVGLHLLGKELRTLPLFELAMMKGDSLDNNFPGLIKSIDTEAKQLQAIEDLYKIVKAQPKYKNMTEPSWKPETKPVHVLTWLLRKLGPLAQGAEWTVDTYLQAGKTRYRFVIYKSYNSQKLAWREEFLPLDFLPGLRKKDQALHDMIIDVIALVSRENKVPFWDEDGDYSEMLQDLLNVPSGGYTVYRLERLHKVYSNGPAAQYLKVLKQRRKVVSISIVQKRLAAYNAKSLRKQYLVWWIRKGLQVASYHQCIKKNSFVPNYIPGEAMTPWQQYKFIWSLHDNDILQVRAKNKLEKAIDKWGDFFPLMFSIAKPEQLLKPIEEDHFPVSLFDFMDYGVKHFIWRYRDYYYKDAFKKQETPSEEFLDDEEEKLPGLKLLDELEFIDLKKQYR
jgi:hypothetical protein